MVTKCMLRIYCSGMRLGLPPVIRGIPVRRVTAFDCSTVANDVSRPRTNLLRVFAQHSSLTNIFWTAVTAGLPPQFRGPGPGGAAARRRRWHSSAHHHRRAAAGRGGRGRRHMDHEPALPAVYAHAALFLPLIPLTILVPLRRRHHDEGRSAAGPAGQPQQGHLPPDGPAATHEVSAASH